MPPTTWFDDPINGASSALFRPDLDPRYPASRPHVMAAAVSSLARAVAGRHDRIATDAAGKRLRII
jgi:hypothetical protein